MYSNAPDVIYRRYDRPVEWLPEPVEWFTGRTQAWCETARQDLARHPRSAYVYLDARTRPAPVVSEPELTGCLRL